MRKLLFLLCLCLFSQLSYAELSCFEFPMAKYSPGMDKLMLRVQSKADSWNDGATLIGSTSKGKSVSVSFNCTKKGKIQSCSQPHGAGEFDFEVEKDVPRLKLSYINLSIADVSRRTKNSKQAINEDFAVYDLASSAEKEGAQSDHLPEITVSGSKITCK